MAFNEARIRHLLRLYADNEATEEQIREMIALLRKDEGDKELESFIQELRKEGEKDGMTPLVDWENMWDAIRLSAVQPATRAKKMYWWRIAAAIIIVLGVGSYFWYNRVKDDQKTAKTEPLPELKKDIQPGGDKAILTLSDGTQIVLDSTANGKLATQGNTEIIKLANGQLAYKEAGGQENKVLYNIMSTPRGGQYRLILPDGSRVWLNAVSSIRYPTAFTGNERRVEITGEAYFEVAASVLPQSGGKKQPFFVEANGITTEVMGTQFNVNSYDDEPDLRVTLLEGLVRVNKDKQGKMLKPGEQAQVSSTIKIVNNVDLEEVMAWKNGRFQFEGAGIEEVMRQIARWYNVDVIYEGKPKEQHFRGGVSRSVEVSKVFKMLETTGAVRFRIEGRRIIVMP